MNNRYDMEMHWASVYWTFEENAFDWRGKPLAISTDTLAMWDGTKFVEYAEVPF